MWANQTLQNQSQTWRLSHQTGLRIRLEIETKKWNPETRMIYLFVGLCFRRKKVTQKLVEFAVTDFASDFLIFLFLLLRFSLHSFRKIPLQQITNTTIRLGRNIDLHNSLCWSVTCTRTTHQLIFSSHRATRRCLLSLDSKACLGCSCELTSIFLNIQSCREMSSPCEIQYIS